MKSEEQFLMLYMYQEGYTEEDMYDLRTVEIVRRTSKFRVWLLKQELGPVIEAFEEAIRNAFDYVKETVGRIFEGLKKSSVERPDPLKRRELSKSTSARNNFRLAHQVDNRKPRHLVRKIIR